jgi:hypothetical protein
MIYKFICFSLADTQNSEFKGDPRHKPVIEPTRKAVGYRHAWRLKFGKIGPWEEAILGVSAGISQNSNAQRSYDNASPFLFLVE